MSELLLVSVPGLQVAGEGALLRVVLTPRLTGPGKTLADYGLADWPALVRDAEVEIQMRDASGAALDPVATTWRSKGDSRIWSEFFGTIEVKPYGGQTTHEDPEIMPTADPANQIDEMYSRVARGVGDPELVRGEFEAIELPALPPAVPPAGDEDTPAFKKPDFHRAIAMLREYPVVLHALGLVVELTIPAELLAKAGASGEVAVRWPGAPEGIGNAVSPRTAFVLSDKRFLPAPTATISEGLVNLQQDEWQIATLDVEGAISRLEGAKAALAENTDLTAQLPALRTNGLTLVQRNRSEALAARNRRAAGNAGAASLVDAAALTADDLVLGYRIDVRKRGFAWHSLTRRIATYSVNGVTIGNERQVEEGHVKAAAAIREGANGPLRANEVVARWNGRNLALPPPEVAAPRRKPERTGKMPYEFEWHHEVDPAQTEVPELRFGYEYELRGRVLDIAGGGLDLDPEGGAGASPHARYGRYEPVAPPEMPPPEGLLKVEGEKTVVDKELLGPGGGFDVLVVRSDPRGDPLGEYPANHSRTLLPAPATFTIAEQHGMLSGDDEATWRNARRALAEPRASAAARNGRHYTWLPDPAAQGVALLAVPWSAGAEPTTVAVKAWGEKTWPDHEPKTVTVEKAEPGEPIGLDWVGARNAELSLPPGQQVTLELSSKLDDDYLDRFAAGAWVAGDDIATEAALSGRHPVITPARTLHVVHAVRRPLAVPAANLTATRVQEGTDALLADPAAPLLGVDRDSTVQVDVSASWNEWGDAPEPEATEEVLEALPVGLGDDALPAIRHEFADTKHRQVIYTLTARSRFRQFFDPGDPEEAFAAPAQIGPVAVPNTARPAPPTVLSVVPAFSWQESDDGTTLTRTRGGGQLRVELGAPWYATGEGERLGLIVAGPLFWEELRKKEEEGGIVFPVDPGSGGVTGIGLEPPPAPDPSLYTTAYRDPLYPGPAPSAQPSAVTGQAEEDGFVKEPGSGTRVLVAPYAVWYAEGRRFADIGFDELAESSYCPFVRLSLTRYQPHSLPNMELSTLVKPDPVPLMPTRTLTVQRTDAGPIVTLSGRGPEGPPNQVEVRLEAVSSEQRGAELTALNTEAGWRPLETFTGTLGTPLNPIPVPPDDHAHRLVIREIENIETSTPPEDPLVFELSARTVFADVLDL
jgi:hypothetical protein